MIKGLYRPSRIKNGKRMRSKFYRLVYRLDGMSSKAWKSLRTTDKQVAEKKAAEFLRERERELHGLILPKTVRDAAARPLLCQLNEFISDLSAQGRTRMYVYNIERRVRRLIADCGWNNVGQIGADAFQCWRSSHGSKAAKTLNDYQDALTGFLKWLVRNKRVVGNALDGVPKAQTRGRERRVRRALSIEELNGLVGVSGIRKIGYLLAALTGLRRNEIKNLQWGDVHLEGEMPFIAVRACTTKNADRAEIPLHPQLARALGEIRPERVEQRELVLHREQLASMCMMRKDLEAASVSFIDGQGRRADFHALRGTFNMLMALRNVDPQTRQIAMRHSDIKLTTNTYIDGSLLPLRGAINALPWLGESAPEGAPVADVASRNVSYTVTKTPDEKMADIAVCACDERELARNGTTGHDDGIGCLARIRT